MTIEAFQHYLIAPEELSDETLPQLRALVTEHPYFSLAGMLYLKNLHLLQDPSFPSELERWAVRVADRRALFHWLEGGESLPSLPTRQEGTETSSSGFSLIDAFLTHHAEEESVNSSVLFQPSISADYLHWSKLHEPEKEELSTLEEPARPLLHQDLIDSFIREEAFHQHVSVREDREVEVTATVPESVRRLEEDASNSLEDSCLTETLARIYIKQKRYEKALQIIQNLRLKNPEKSSYFADQIRFLEKLIINTKK